MRSTKEERCFFTKALAECDPPYLQSSDIRDGVTIRCSMVARIVADADRCAKLEEDHARLRHSEGIVRGMNTLLYANEKELEAQLQQSRDDYETALRENEKTSAQLRDAQHDANNAATLREAAELARSERDRVEGENKRLRAGMEKVRDLLATIKRSGETGAIALLATALLTAALSIAGVERG